MCLQDSIEGKTLLPSLGSQHDWVPFWSAYTPMCAARGASWRNQRSACGCRATTYWDVGDLVGWLTQQDYCHGWMWAFWEGQAGRGGGGIACYLLLLPVTGRAVVMHGFLPWMDVEPVENIWVMISRQTKVGEVTVCLLQTMWSGSRQLEEASHSHSSWRL